MNKKSVILRDEKDAILLSDKLTNKNQIDLPSFWEEHKQQFLLNSYAIPETLKKSLRKSNLEMFDFFWAKSCEHKIDLYNNSSFINDAIAIVTVLNNTSLLDHLCDKITLPKLILNPHTFTIILEGRYHLTHKVDVDMFWHLYQKCYANNFSLAAKGILACASYKDPSAMNLCINFEGVKPNPKLLPTWDAATKIALSKGNEITALNIITTLGKKLPNFNFEDILLCAVKYNANNVVTVCMENIKKVGHRLYENMFIQASLSNNINIIRNIGKKIKDSNIISKAFIHAINTSADSMLDALEDVTSFSRNEFLGLDDTYVPIKISDVKNNDLAQIYTIIDKEAYRIENHNYTRVHLMDSKQLFKKSKTQKK